MEHKLEMLISVTSGSGLNSCVRHESYQVHGLSFWLRSVAKDYTLSANSEFTVPVYWTFRRKQVFKLMQILLENKIFGFAMQCNRQMGVMVDFR